MAVAALVPVASASFLEAQDAAKRAAEAKQASPFIQELAGHVRKRWVMNRDAKEKTIEPRLLQCLRQRKSEYDPGKLEAIKAQGGSEIYIGLSSLKCRGASGWLRDTLMGKGTEKPWGLKATPIPDLPPDVVEGIRQQLMQVAMQEIMMTGQQPNPDVMRQMATQMRDDAMAAMQDEAAQRVERMELKMEDQLIEGGFPAALDQFIDDLVTFPAAHIKGPVMRNRKKLKWQGNGLVPVDEIVKEWERVDPFNLYPAPWASNPNEGPLIERHKMTRDDLEALLGVEGYDEDAVRKVLSEFDTGTLNEWLAIDTQQPEAEGKDTSQVDKQETVDALQLWDTVQGKMLVDWGMDKGEVPDQDKSYAAEIWLIGNTVVKAVLNYDPLGRRPYYKASYEEIPGAYWGNGVCDLVRDTQDMCNAAARALSNNMGISSGPQVGINVSRLPAGENPSNMIPWKIWQFQNTDYQDASAPITFFQPQSNAQELMAVFEKFSQRADEDSGIPRYMTGEHAPGAGRTASGLSMLINNAGKALKQVISNIDSSVLSPLLERLYQHNLRYSQDPELIGDVNIIATGAMSLVVKEAAQVRRNEFLALVLNSPVASQIVGMPGIAELMRENAKTLDMNVDRLVPTRQKIDQMVAAQAAQQQAMMEVAMNPEMEQVQFQRDDQGNVTGATKKKPKNLLPDGSAAGGRDGSTMRNVVSGRNG